MAQVTKPPVLDETARDVGAQIVEQLGKIADKQYVVTGGPSRVLEYDKARGRYTNESIKAWLDSQRDGKAYGVHVPNDNSTECTKTGANAGMAKPTPGTEAKAAVDPYVGVGPFRFFEVNGGADPDGTLYVTGILGDGHYRRDGSNGNVMILAPTLFQNYSETDKYSDLTVSDTQLAGMVGQPKAYLPSGELRPYMLYAKYPLVDGPDGVMSCSGYTPRLFNVSYNSLIDITKSQTTGYSGRDGALDWYLKAMLLLKYGTKNSQSVFTGCTGYDVSAHPSVAETGVTRVIVSNADAAKLLVGSCVSLGSALDGTKAVTDRWDARTHDKADRVVIRSIDAYDADNKAIVLDTTKTFSTATTDLLSTMPWHSGACDGVEGDGSPTSCTDSRQPFVLQGIELGHGMYEVMGDLVLSSDGKSGWKVMYAADTARVRSNDASTGFAEVGTLPGPAADGWNYATGVTSMGGLLVQRGTGASQTSGVCDGNYKNSDATSGAREWPSLGALRDRGVAGLWCVFGDDGLGFGWWNIGSRLSATGRGGEAA